MPSRRASGATSVDELRSIDVHVPESRRQAVAQNYSPILIVLTLLATLGVLMYARFLLAPGNRGDTLPWLIVIAAEGILVIQTILAMWTILSGARDPRDYKYFSARDALYGATDPTQAQAARRAGNAGLYIDNRPVTVDVFITVYGEPVDIVRRTVEAALAIRGRHITWILDDGKSPEVRALAEELGCRYLTRLSNQGAKAGNVNHALAIANGDFYCIFDADFVPSPDFLEQTMPFFQDNTVAFVQTPQTYGNLHSLIARGAGYMQTVFYRFVQPGRNHFNAAFCVGTNVVFRRDAIHDIGGMYVDSKSEDVWTSLKLHERGWRSVYLAKTLAVGDAPETIEAYVKQQLRWATGGFEILFRSNPLSPKRKLTPEQRLMYMITATHYLTGIAPGLLLLVPPLEIFFGLHPVNVHVSVWQWLLTYAGFYVMQILLAFFTLGSFRGEVLVLAAVSYPVYMKALTNVIAGREQDWHVTGSQRDAASPFNFIIPQVGTFVFLLLTSFVAIWECWKHSTFTLGTAWNVTNTIILGVFLVIAAAEGRAARRARNEITEGAVA